MGDAKKKPRLGHRLVQGLTDVRDALRRGEPLEKKFTCRTVILNLKPREYDPESIRAVRARLGVSQSLFAEIVGASVDTVASWEQGLREPSPMARRLLEEITRNQEHWRKILKDAMSTVEL